RWNHIFSQAPRLRSPKVGLGSYSAADAGRNDSELKQIMVPAIWIVAAAAILSGFFALNSFALRSFSRAKLEDVFAGSRGRKRLEFLDTHLESVRMTLSLCATMAYLTLLAGMLLLYAGNGNLGGWQIFTAAAVSGAIIAIVGIAVPHAWARCAGEKVLAVTLPALIGLWLLLYPITAIMQAFDLPIRRLSGQVPDGDEDGQEEAKQEILQAAADGAAEGTVDAEEVEMIESVMEFSDLDTAQIMTPRTDIFALETGISWMDAAKQIHAAGHTRVPIYEDNLDNITGIIYAKDLLEYIGMDHPPTLENICRKPFFVPETKTLNDLLREFKARKVHLAVVLDEYGGTAGLVSIEDVLEELVGDISDEYDIPEKQQLRRINETTVEVDGRLRVDELNDELEMELPEDEDYDTVAGFAIAELGYIPTQGETFQTANAKFSVLEADERKITKLRIEKLPPEQD
ncbi:MAG: hemolysin family protein, partial [Phycisphaerae bacterium]|nr:hemolysin family protein [Phycisphaerae bacterium]